MTSLRRGLQLLSLLTVLGHTQSKRNKHNAPAANSVISEETVNQTLAPPAKFGSGEFRLEGYELDQKAVRLWFKSRGDWNPNLDVDAPGASEKRPDCPRLTFPQGCISLSKLENYLDGKWIPGREASQDVHFVLKGRFFKKAFTRSEIKAAAKRGKPLELPETHTAESMLHDVIDYILTRPYEAVPEEVRTLLRPDATVNNWPGTDVSKSREVFLPPLDERQSICNTTGQDCKPFVEFDVESLYDVPSRVGVSGDEWMEEEEGTLMQNKGFKFIFYVAMALTGIVLPLAFVVSFVRWILPTPPPKQVRCVFTTRKLYDDLF
ncbi:hypothetical protein CYMTET_23175 [Cymbomonas tetramitiformis]|uniref:Uncharacterized protein n=1 Tax=Cymbomonas tetramitiformis TaxID=36881 RepID=A0AAE0FYS3_9CHLO|nr:hypothetical protein CYMTET_23175 [Cymbomonas tetramitiformis]